jgi:uncharacterized protein (DUF58 family)
MASHRSMWRNFGTSIGLLAIAMMAALYSSSATRDGRMIGAVIAAFVALGIAVWVGIRFVPRLAASVDWEWLPFLSHYHVTREGWIYFGAVTVVVFAAINTANNLLYMVLSALLAVLLLSGFLSGLNFRFLRMTVRIPSHCFAGEPFPISLQVRNEKRFFPSLSIQFDQHSATWFTSADEGTFRFSSFYIPVIRSQAHVSQTGQAMLTKRGRYTMNKLKASSRYPFGFFLKHRSYDVEGECICYPEIIPQERMNVSIADIQGTSERFERGVGYDLYTIRDYVPSDSTRHVHWKASAKTATLKTREYAAEETRRVVLLFDRFGQQGDVEKFEQLVSQTASIAFHFIKSGIEVALVSDDWRSGHGSSDTVLESMLQYLALVKMSAFAESPSAYRIDGALNLSLRSASRS